MQTSGSLATARASGPSPGSETVIEREVEFVAAQGRCELEAEVLLDDHLDSREGPVKRGERNGRGRTNAIVCDAPIATRPARRPRRSSSTVTA